MNRYATRNNEIEVPIGVRAFAVALFAVLGFSHAALANMSENSESTDAVLGVAADGTFVVHSHFSSEGYGSGANFVILGADGAERARLELCHGDGGSESCKKPGQWAKHGDAALLGRLAVTSAVDIKMMGEQILRVFALTPLQNSSLVANDAKDERDDERIKFYLRTPSGHIGLADGNTIIHAETGKLRSKQLYEHPSSRFLFLRYTLKATENHEAQIENRLEVIPRGRIDAVALIVEGKRARGEAAIPSFRAALLVDPNSIPTRKLLVDALLAAKKSWATALPLLPAPFVRRPFQGYFGAPIDVLESAEASARWPQYNEWLEHQKKSYAKATK